MKRPLAIWMVVACSGLLAAEPELRHEPITGLDFVRIAKACFQMGTDTTIMVSGSQPWQEFGYSADLAAHEKPAHEVCLDAFWIGRTEVPAQAFQRVMGEYPLQGKEEFPAAGVTWHQARAFAQRLGELSANGEKYRLPTEAEWEAACRAGAKRNKPPQRADGWSEAWERPPHPYTPLGKVTASGHKTALGIEGMLGNVWEWVEDGFRGDAYTKHALFNPMFAEGEGTMRVIRGGSHRSEAVFWRCAARGSYDAAASLPTIGFRLVREGP